ncbi:DnaJ-domain-containing protein [Tothia fuscella]|uniref:DnaJ-domain-containing protein n=1 Tax=Tothia fuscella TaxID=1048955 RepID=A0A9P4NUF7_9PEZI|nr:DnaJ-domain-containing protein [Tothia fuscella]
MAPSPITNDYYSVLEVKHTASLEEINKSYKALAMKLHPDKNIRIDTTNAFQLLGQAYETLKNQDQRRAYDLIYPSIVAKGYTAKKPQTTCPPGGSTPQAEAANEAAQIAAILKSKSERAASWHTKKNVLDGTIFELQRSIRRLEQEIKNLNSIFAAEAAEEAQKNSWTTWILSPLYKKRVESEHEKERKERERQERRIEKDMKERKLDITRAAEKQKESLLTKATKEFDSANRIDDGKIELIKSKKYFREAREAEAREKVRKEQEAKMWKEYEEQQKKGAREAEAAYRKAQAESQAAGQKWREEAGRTSHHAYFNSAQRSTPQPQTSTCSHNGWWPKVQGRAACPDCNDVWTYLLQCPGCQKRACPKCQSGIRAKRWTNRAGAPRRDPPPNVRTSDTYFEDDEGVYDW